MAVQIIFVPREICVMCIFIIFEPKRNKTAVVFPNFEIFHRERIQNQNQYFCPRFTRFVSICSKDLFHNCRKFKGSLHGVIATTAILSSQSGGCMGFNVRVQN